MAITTADIHAAADALAAAGKKPTLAAIRTALGGGSFSTISEAMQSWKKHEQKQATTAAPQAVTDRAAELAAQVWAIAQELAEQRIQAERKEMEKQRQELEAQRNEATELADTMAAELDLARAELKKQETTLEELRKTAAVLAEKVESATERAKRAEQQADAAHTAETAARVEAAELRGKLEASKPVATKQQRASESPVNQSLPI